MTFKEMFKEVRYFSDNTYVVNGALALSTAKKMIEKRVNHSVKEEDITNDVARFGFPPHFIEDADPQEGPIWYTGAHGKGSKPVWVYQEKGEEKIIAPPIIKKCKGCRFNLNKNPERYCDKFIKDPYVNGHVCNVSLPV